MGVGQARAEQVILTLGTSQATELVRTLDLRTILFPDGSIRVESAEDHIILITIKDLGLNIEALSNETLHALHRGVANELRPREQCGLNLISEYKVNNEQMFVETMQTLKEKEAL